MFLATKQENYLKIRKLKALARLSTGDCYVTRDACQKGPDHVLLSTALDFFDGQIDIIQAVGRAIRKVVALGKSLWRSFDPSTLRRYRQKSIENSKFSLGFSILFFSIIYELQIVDNHFYARGIITQQSLSQSYLIYPSQLERIHFKNCFIKKTILSWEFWFTIALTI